MLGRRSNDLCPLPLLSHGHSVVTSGSLWKTGVKGGGSLYGRWGVGLRKGGGTSTGTKKKTLWSETGLGSQFQRVG